MGTRILTENTTAEKVFLKIKKNIPMILGFFVFVLLYLSFGYIVYVKLIRNIILGSGLIN